MLDKAGEDLYDSVRGKLRSLLGTNQDGVDALEKVEKKPDSKGRRTTLQEELGDVGLSQDHEVVKLAVQLLDYLQEKNLLPGDTYQTIMQSDGSVVMGPGAVVAGAHSKVVAATAENAQAQLIEQQNIETQNIYLSPKVDTIPRKDNNDWRTRYLQEIASETNILPWAPVMETFPSKENNEAFGLSDVYTDLDTTDVQRIEREEEYRELMAQRDKAERISAQATINDHRCVLIMGDPGSGKSTFAKHVAHSLAQAGLAEDPSTWLKALAPWEHEVLLPVWIELRTLAAGLDRVNDENDLAAQFFSALQDLLNKQCLKEIGADLEKYIQGRAEPVLLLFDGLDEVPSNLRKKVVDLVNVLAERYKCHRIVVTCRPYAYLDQPYRLTGFHQVTLAAFSQDQINRFIQNWYDLRVKCKAMTASDADWKRRRLQQATQSSHLHELAERPFLLTVMAQLHTYTGQLPDDRTELYAGAVDLLLQRWEGKSGGEEGVIAYLDMQGLKINDLKDGLGEVAFHAQSQRTKGELGEITEADLHHRMQKYFQRDRVKADKFVTYIRERAGLLIAHKTEAYKFPHLSFQEYLAAYHLVSHDNYPFEPARLVREDITRWREVFVLSCGVATRNGHLKLALLAVADLCPESVKEAPSNDPLIWQCAQLAGEALLEIGLIGVQRDEPGQKLHKKIQDWLLVAMRNDDVLTPIQRAAAGRTLAKLGDPRKEVLEAEHIELLEIPKGPFTMGEEGEAFQCDIPKAYKISKYPITNAQFQEFVKAGGYMEASFWKEAEADGYWTKGKFKGRIDDEGRDGPAVNQDPFGLANHPVVGVSWYEALAFTRWLTTRLQEAGKIPKGWEIQLPNEPEWERAARGTEGWKYSWEGEPNPNNANYVETGVGTTSAVGCFPQGESPNHIEEMSGNVWEWTRSVYDRDYYSADQTKWVNRELLDSKGSRVLRGGAFFFTDDLMRCACRFNLHPYNSDWLVGFRVVASPFSSR